MSKGRADEMSDVPSLLTAQAFMAWAGVFSFYFWLFWYYVPFALAARELAMIHSRYA
jgi:hypothetical protein